MASLTGSSVATTYDQLLTLPSGGGNTTTLVAITDGNAGTTFCLQLATTKAMIEGNGSTLYFFDEGGESISADNAGVLSIAGGAEIDITTPTVDINASTAVTVDGPAVTIADGTGSKPLIIVKNTANDTTGSELRFVMDKGSAGADGDDLGTISFYGDDAGQNQTAFAKIVAEVSEADETDEAGKLSFYVAESDGTNTALTAGLILEGEHATDGEIDVTIGAGASSTTTIAGDLTVANGIVGIGTASPEGKLNIFSASAGSVTPESTYDELVIENSDHAGITILTPADKKGGIGFGSPTDAGRAELKYDHASDEFMLRGQSKELMVINSSSGNVGIGTSSPGQLLDVNSGGGNMIADGYDTHSLAVYKENIEDASGYLDKVLACPAQKWNRKPFVSADEIKEAVLEEFGEDVLIEEAVEAQDAVLDEDGNESEPAVEAKEAVYGKQYSVWDELFPEDSSHRQKALYNMPDGDLKTWIDDWCEAKRVEMRPEDKWQKKRLGLVADAELTAEHLPEVVSINDDGEPTGIDTMTYIGILHNAIQELSAKVEALEG